MKTKHKKTIILTLTLLIIVVPLATFAFHESDHNQLVVKCLEADGCDWDDFMDLINGIINFLIFYLSLPIAALAFAYSGFLYMTSGDDVGKRKKAKDVFINVFKGLVIAVAAFLIVKAILIGLDVDTDFILLQ